MLRSGIAPRKAALAAPPPARPPPRAAAARGSGPGPRCGCVRLGAGVGAPGSATPAGCARRWNRVLLLRPPTCEHPGGRHGSRYYQEHRSWSPGTRGQKGDTKDARRPFGFTRSSPAELASPLSLALLLRRGGGCRSCHSSSQPRRRAAESSRVGFFPRGNPDPGGATVRAQPLPGKQLPGFAPATGRGGAMG